MKGKHNIRLISTLHKSLIRCSADRCICCQKPASKAWVKPNAIVTITRMHAPKYTSAPIDVHTAVCVHTFMGASMCDREPLPNTRLGGTGGPAAHTHCASLHQGRSEQRDTRCFHRRVHPTHQGLWKFRNSATTTGCSRNSFIVPTLSCQEFVFANVLSQ